MANNDANNAANQQRNVENASRAKYPMDPIPEAASYKSSGDESENFILFCRQRNDLDNQLLKWAFKLAERNVSPYYKQLSIGWQPKVKLADLQKTWARYLVALDSKKTPVAYAMFRFDMDYGHSVLYCYELQIEICARRKGLGKHMITALEKCAKHWRMEKVVLTVLKNNDNGKAFFKTMGYRLDESSPDILAKADYEILSKTIDQ